MSDRAARMDSFIRNLRNNNEGAMIGCHHDRAMQIFYWNLQSAAEEMSKQGYGDMTLDEVAAAISIVFPKPVEPEPEPRVEKDCENRQCSNQVEFLDDDICPWCQATLDEMEGDA